MLQESKSMWGRSRKAAVPVKQLTSVIDGLKEVYFNKVRAPWQQHCLLCLLRHDLRLKDNG